MRLCTADSQPPPRQSLLNRCLYAKNSSNDLLSTRLSGGCRVLGAKVFSKPLPSKVDESWRDSLMRVYKSGQQSIRVAVSGL